MMTATQARVIADESKKDSAWEATGKLLAFVLLIVIGTMYYGVVIRQLWAWFIVPAFGAVPLSLVTAIGIDLLASVLRGYTHDPESKDKDLGELVALGFKRTFFGPTTFLLVGYVVHRFA